MDKNFLLTNDAYVELLLTKATTAQISLENYHTMINYKTEFERINHPTINRNWLYTERTRKKYHLKLHMLFIMLRDYSIF